MFPAQATTLRGSVSFTRGMREVYEYEPERLGGGISIMYTRLVVSQPSAAAPPPPPPPPSPPYNTDPPSGLFPIQTLPSVAIRPVWKSVFANGSVTVLPFGNAKSRGTGRSLPQFAARPVSFEMGRPWELIFPDPRPPSVPVAPSTLVGVPPGEGARVRVIRFGESLISQLYPSLRFPGGTSPPPPGWCDGYAGRSSTTAARNVMGCLWPWGRRVVMWLARSEAEGDVRRGA